MWDITAHVLRSGGDVILDFGFWTRAERYDFAKKAAELGATCRVQYDDVTLDELERRIIARNSIAGGHFAIPVDILRHWATLFEAPGPDELSGRFSASEFSAWDSR